MSCHALNALIALRPNLELKTRPKQLLGSLPLDIVLLYSALFTFLSGGTLVLLAYPPGDIILAQLASPLNDVIFCLHQDQETYLSTNIGPEVFFVEHPSRT
jgi:hypothetical protein